MKEIEEISPLKLSYFFDATIGAHESKDLNSVKELMSFLNSYSAMGEMVDFDLYFNTPGGSYPDYNVLKAMIEACPFNVTIINAAEMSSYGFMLLYTTEGVNKKLSPYCTSTIHTVSAAFEDRDERRNDNFIKTMRATLDKCNQDFLQMLKDNKIVTAADYKRVERGEDVTLNHEQLHKIMLHCPYGVYLH